MSAPTPMRPSSTRIPPNQITATELRLTTSITIGKRLAIQRPAVIETRVRSSLARANRARSWGSRTNARTTLSPVICSRSTRLTSSMRVWTSRKFGTIRVTTKPTQASRTGIAATRIQDSPMSWRIAITMPPIIMIGTVTAIVVPISTSICTCWTSLVVRVISDGAPKVETSRPEKVPTRWNSAARRSRPSPIAARAPNQTATTEPRICTTDTASIISPTRTM